MNNEYRKYVKTFCEACKETEKALHVHHINHNHKDNSPNNLVTLCIQCHASRHAMERKINPLKKSVDWEGYVRERRIRAYRYKYPEKVYPF